MPQETTLEKIGGGHTATVCDIVFVHGLNGDAHVTWRHDKKSDDCWVNWVAEDHP